MGRSGQVNGLFEIMMMEKEVSGFFLNSNAWLLPVHRLSQNSHIFSPDPTGISGPQNAHAGFGGSRGTVLRSSSQLSSASFTPFSTLLWMWSRIKGEILPNGETKTALCFQLSLQPMEKSPQTLKYLPQRRSQDT